MIRPLTREDLAEYLRMRKSLWPDCSDEMHRFEMDAQLNSHASPVFVHQRDNDRLGAFIEISIRARVDGSMSEKVAYIEGWYVDPDLRSRGIGRTLVLAAENWARGQGLTEIASDAELWNDRSIAAHAKLGFKETFRLVHFLKVL
jgi:aminoglycoside 6'-N-acetyltransferase I